VDSHPHSRHRGGHYGGRQFRRGQLWIFVVFCLLRLVDASYYARWFLAPIDLSRVHVLVIVQAIWTTPLLIAIWHRKTWARYCLAFLLAFLASAEGLIMADYTVILPEVMRNPVFPLVIFSMLIHAGCLAILIGVKSVRRLTNPSYA
jgi:hypothetical protein